jgi:hypothetical protein
MADEKISALTAVVTPDLTDTFAVVQGGVTKKETGTQLRTVLFPAVLTAGADVSGTLPAANQVDQAMGGDCSGTTGTCTVAKVNGITCTGTPAAGAVLRATSASAAAWGQLDLADTDAVTGVLPTGNVATTLTGKTLTTATIDADQNTITNIDNADIKASAAIAVSKLAVGNAADVLTTTGGVAVWAAPTAFTPPTGTGFCTVTAGVLDAASRKVDLASTTWVTGTLPAGNGGTGITSLGAGVATVLGTPSGANLASALTSALSVSKGGTGVTALTSFTTAITTTGKVTAGSLATGPRVTNASTGTLHNIAYGPIIALTDNCVVTGIDASAATDGTFCLLLAPALATGITLSHETGSSGANQISSYTGTTLNLYEKSFTLLVYDATATKWKVLTVPF